MNSLKREVLKSFKSLHKARQKVFRDDDRALNASRKRINEEYAMNKHVKDETAIRELVKYALDVEKQLLSTVIQAKRVSPNKYKARITEETIKFDNVPYKDG